MAEEKKNKKEVDEKDLKDVNGGGRWSANIAYSSGDLPMFKPGDKVIVRCTNLGGYEYLRGTIRNVNSGKSGIIFEEFTYYVNFDDGGYEEDVYESQMVVSENDTFVPRTKIPN